jgi:methylated-DNA-[protein]-cysteine S-methyltransferase
MTTPFRERIVESPLGPLRLVADGDALAGLYLPAHRRMPDLRTTDGRGHPVLERARRELEAYFAGERLAFDLPLALAGTPFQRAVWAALCRIPPGETRSYGALAAELGGGARAVGSANARNPVSIVVPCHRVVGADGRLTGYAGGEAAKAWLLAHERRLCPGPALFAP